MRKTLVDLAKYLKEIVVPEAQEAYALNPVFKAYGTEEAIWEGVNMFRAFLYQLLDNLAAKGDNYDSYKKVAHEYENRTTLSGYYPFIYNVKNILIKTGFYGVPEENGEILNCSSKILDEKLSSAKTLECLRFLNDCGLCIDGIDFNVKKINMPDIKTLKISYPKKPSMLTGMKVMAIAEIEHSTLINQDVFFRCDYRAIKKDETNVFSILKDTIKPLSSEVQDFVLQLHRRYTGKGLKCTAEIKGFWIYIKYSYKRKDLWGVNASLNNGYHINVKAINTDKYMDTIETFSPYLKEIIAKGFGCGRKREGVGHCDGGCRGMPIPLDESVLSMKDDIITWFDLGLTN